MTTRNRPDAEDADGLLVLAIAAGCTYEQAADQVGVGVSTVSRRMREYPFRQRVNQMRAELVERGGGRIADEMAASAAFLARVRDDDNEPTTLRIKAATELLGFAMRYRTLDKAESFKPTMADLDADLMDWASGSLT